jgi:UPF0755 protein
VQLSQDISPKRPLGPPGVPVVPQQQIPRPQLALEAPEVQPLLPAKTKRSKKKLVLWIIGGFVALLVILTAAALMWYKTALTPVNAGDTARIRVEISSGSTPAMIAQELEGKKLIRSQLAFDIYTRLTGTRATLQAGTYSLAPSESTQAIVSHLVSGNVDHFSMTFLPGATLAENTAKLVKAGYTVEEVEAALKKTYDSPLFADKPASADLEGYIYGETYDFDSSATVEQILSKTFEQYYKVIQDNNLVEGFKAHGLNLYQGITLASIIQREVPGHGDQKQVAQVFYSRLGINMPLGSDVTYQYAAKKLGVEPSPSLDSPYNTRRYPGLPPGPIATPGVGALLAVANPSQGDYLYFLSGDDDVTYFARTNEEHEANIRDHCKVKCLIP